MLRGAAVPAVAQSPPLPVVLPMLVSVSSPVQSPPEGGPMLRLLLLPPPKAAAPVLIRLRRLAFLSPCCRSLPFPSPSSSGVGGSGRSSRLLVLVQSRLYPERNVVRLAPAPVPVPAPAALLPASVALPAVPPRGVGGLPPRTALPLATVPPPGRGGLALPAPPAWPPAVLLEVAEGSNFEDEADRGVGGLPPAAPAGLAATAAAGGALFLPTLLVVVVVHVAAALVVCLGGSPALAPALHVLPLLSAVLPLVVALVSAAEVVVALRSVACCRTGSLALPFAALLVASALAPGPGPEPLPSFALIAPPPPPPPSSNVPTVLLPTSASAPRSEAAGSASAAPLLASAAPLLASAAARGRIRRTLVAPAFPAAAAAAVASASATASSVLTLAETLSEGLVAVLFSFFCCLEVVGFGVGLLLILPLPPLRRSG
mmetsp:Transcript_11383/g.32216  ORF Transcript_11383/g.32216 Transcript_11383/m.32216 type:complete len:430 (-) Transcript_11383:84-1373(-)